MVQPTPNHFAGLEYLATAIILLDDNRRVLYVNPGAEVIFAFSAKKITGLLISEVFPDCEILMLALQNAITQLSPFREHEFAISTNRHNSFVVTCTVTPIDSPNASLILEFQQMDTQLRAALYREYL